MTGYHRHDLHEIRGHQREGLPARRSVGVLQRRCGKAARVAAFAPEQPQLPSCRAVTHRFLLGLGRVAWPREQAACTSSTSWHRGRMAAWRSSSPIWFAACSRGACAKPRSSPSIYLAAGAHRQWSHRHRSGIATVFRVKVQPDEISVSFFIPQEEIETSRVSIVGKGTQPRRFGESRDFVS